MNENDTLDVLDLFDIINGTAEHPVEETGGVRLTRPECGWSTLHVGDVPGITLSYIQDVPADIVNVARMWADPESGDAAIEFDGEGVYTTLLLRAGDATAGIVYDDGVTIDTGVPSKIVLLRIIDDMLSDVRTWADWRELVNYDDPARKDAIDEAARRLYDELIDARRTVRAA